MPRDTTIKLKDPMRPAFTYEQMVELENLLVNPIIVGGSMNRATRIGSTLAGTIEDRVNVVTQFFFQATAPSSGMKTNDYWIDSDDNKIYRYTGATWVEVQDDQIAQAIADAATAQATADGKIYVYKQTTAPSSGMGVGDLWFDTDDGNKVYRYSGSAWDEVRDTGIATAIANAATAQATADGKVTTFIQTTAPTAEGEGDLWVDSDDGYRCYRWSGAAWVDIQDTDIGLALSNAAAAQSTANTKIISFIQTSAPTASEAGDLWMDSDDGNKLYRWSGSAWLEIQDDAISTALTNAAAAQTTADTKIVSFYATTAPTASETGDIWFDTDDDNKPYRWSGAAWVAAEFDVATWTKIIGIPPALFQTYYQASAPGSGMATGDYWVDSDDNKLYRYSGAAWVEIQDDGIATAIANAATAQGTADTKIVTFVQASAPTAVSTGDLWMDTDDNNNLYRWSGAAWVAYSQDYAAWAKITGAEKPEDYATHQTMVKKTTGEDIVNRNCVCMGHSGIEVGSQVSGDTWADEANPTTPHGDSAQMRAGAAVDDKNYWGYVKILVPSGIQNSDIDTVKVKFQVAGGSIPGGYSVQLAVYRLTTETWDEAEVTWNEKPADTGVSAGASAVYSSVPEVGTWVEIDITQLFKDWNAGVYSNHGIAIKCISGGGATRYLNFYTKEAGGDIQARFDIKTWADKTKAYKADADYWEQVIMIVGFATEAKTSGNTIRIQTSGVIDGFSGLIPGADYYVDTTAGGITTTPGSGAGRRKVGKAVSATELLITLDPPLEYVGIAPAAITVGGDSVWTKRDITASVPKRAKIADISLYITSGTQTLGVRKTDSGINRTRSSSAVMAFCNMPTEITEDTASGVRSVENYSSSGSNSMAIVGYWI